MKKLKLILLILLCLSLLFPVASYAEMYYADELADDLNQSSEVEYRGETYQDFDESNEPSAFKDSLRGEYSGRLPKHIRAQGEKVIVVDPSQHAFGAYNAQGKLIRWGLATSGADWCDDIDEPCRTKTGVFRIYAVGDGDCASRKFPIPDGGAPMPYCMYFNGGQAIHGSSQVVYDNISHGCVRVNVSDAEWLRYQFIESPNASNRYRGTKVIVGPY